MYIYFIGYHEYGIHLKITTTTTNKQTVTLDTSSDITEEKSFQYTSYG